MKRRKFISLLVGAISWPFVARAQNQTNAKQDANDQVGQVATLQGIATVVRGNVPPSVLHSSDAIYKNDVLETGASSSLGVTFDDETTLSLTANARIVVNEFVYEEGGKGNKAVFNIARGTVAFVASLVAKTGDMTISTPTATLGIRGTTGVVDVPDSTTAGASVQPKSSFIRMPMDGWGDRSIQPARRAARCADARVERICHPPGPGGRFVAVPFQIPPQEVARDRGVVQRLFASHNIGRQLTIQRLQLRGPNSLRPNNKRPNNLRQPGGSPSRIAVRAANRRTIRARRNGAASSINCGNSIRSSRRKMSRYARRGPHAGVQPARR